VKKYLAFILAAIFVLGFSASAFAIHATIPGETTPVVSPKDIQIKLGGEIRIRGWYNDNLTNAAGTANAAAGYPYAGSSHARYDHRVRLLVDVKSGANLSGRVHLETGAVGAADGNSSDTTVWGALPSAEGGRKQATLDTVVEAWIAYTGTGLFGVPAGIKVGHMPIIVGAGQFFDHRRYGDDAILFVLEPTKELELNLSTLKLEEGAMTDNTDDKDLYTLMATYKLDKATTLGANYTYINQSDTEMSLQNVGLFARGKVAGLGYRASADFQFGDLSPTVKARGWAATLGLNYKVDPVTLRASFGYGSGDKLGSAGKNEEFQTFLNNFINYTVVYDYRVITAAKAKTIAKGIANTTYFNVGADFSPMKDLSLALDLFVLRASKSLSTLPNTLGESKTIGTEVDFKATYRVAKNLTYFINSGILFAGDFYKAAATGPTSDPKNAIVFHHGLTFSF
jgi:hypothetical protein